MDKSIGNTVFWLAVFFLLFAGAIAFIFRPALFPSAPGSYDNNLPILNGQL